MKWNWKPLQGLWILIKMITDWRMYTSDTKDSQKNKSIQIIKPWQMKPKIRAAYPRNTTNRRIRANLSPMIHVCIRITTWVSSLADIEKNTKFCMRMLGTMTWMFSRKTNIQNWKTKQIKKLKDSGRKETVFFFFF